MISRKEYILNRPWQERKYDLHRRKVQSAIPAIDNKPPMTRQHVSVKWKKRQKEKERADKIERENFLLLQRLNYVMRTNRVDNYWKTPQPGLSVPGLYQVKFTDYNKSVFKPLCRKSKCFNMVVASLKSKVQTYVNVIICVMMSILIIKKTD